jgi:transposase-like protein
MDELFKGRHFDREIIVLCVRWYLRYKLSFRDLVEMMAERGLSLAHTTIMRWIRVVTLPAASAKCRRRKNCQAAATAVRHVSIAAARSVRCVWAEVRWRWTLKVL